MADSRADALTVSSTLGSVTFDNTALDAISGSASGSVTVTVAEADTSSFSEEDQALVGSRPVYDLTVTADGTTISDFGGGEATVGIPYTHADGEDDSKIVIYYLSDSGELIMVTDCVYDAVTGIVTFKTGHFSTYAVGYNDVSFTDVSGWYEDYVYYLAARDTV